MKLSSLLVAGLLVAASVVIAAPGAKADGVQDPNITIGSGKGSIPTTAGGSDLDPIQTTDENNGVVFCYGVLSGGTCVAGDDLPALSAVYVEVTAYAGEDPTFFQSESWTCTPGAGATSCGTAPVCNSAQSGAMGCPDPSISAFEFVFFAKDGQGNNVDFFQPGEEITVYTPEPGALLLLLMGIGAVVAFGLRRRQGLLAS
jgi:PEP-CTERM motif